MTSTAPDTGQRAARAADDAVEAALAAGVARLEERFGDAGDPGNPVGRAAVVAADERGEVPAAGEDLLTAYGLNAHFVPRELGGRFATLEGLVAVMRAVYRRDPGLGLGYGAGSFMAAVNVWTAGDREQQERLAALLLSGGRAACAYHELAHGNDLARAELTALPGPDGRLRLNGRKEVVANLGRAEAMVLFARTDPAPGPRSHSQLLLDTAALDAGAVRDLGRFGSSGMRGVRLGGLEFTDCLVPGGSVVRPSRPGPGDRRALLPAHPYRPAGDDRGAARHGAAHRAARRGRPPAVRRHRRRPAAGADGARRVLRRPAAHRRHDHGRGPRRAHRARAGRRVRERGQSPGAARPHARGLPALGRARLAVLPAVRRGGAVPEAAARRAAVGLRPRLAGVLPPGAAPAAAARRAPHLVGGRGRAGCRPRPSAPAGRCPRCPGTGSP